MSASESSDALRVFRFAPSPTGYLHRGHALSALLNQRAAEATGGRFLLRMENVDTTRARPDFEAAIFEDLAWLGLKWEKPVLHQSGRLDAYAKALAELDKLGLLYPAFMSRSEIRAAVEKAGPKWPRDPDGAPHYPGPERTWPASRRQAEMDSGRPYALRLDMARASSALAPLSWNSVDPFGVEPPATHTARPAQWGDVILARKEVHSSYHIAVVVDDAFQCITDVVRGKDLQPATSLHRLLQTLLGLPAPRYFHHRLILDSDGKKLSKSEGSESIRARRDMRESREELIASLGI
jgi:glutamyl-Q tRNA(Asp) synthetase